MGWWGMLTPAAALARPKLLVLLVVLAGVESRVMAAAAARLLHAIDGLKGEDDGEVWGPAPASEAEAGVGSNFVGIAQFGQPGQGGQDGVFSSSSTSEARGCDSNGSIP